MMSSNNVLENKANNRPRHIVHGICRRYVTSATEYKRDADKALKIYMKM